MFVFSFIHIINSNEFIFNSQNETSMKLIAIENTNACHSLVLVLLSAVRALIHVERLAYDARTNIHTSDSVVVRAPIHARRFACGARTSRLAVVLLLAVRASIQFVRRKQTHTNAHTIGFLAFMLPAIGLFPSCEISFTYL